MPERIPRTSSLDLRVRGMRKSATVDINERCLRLISEGKTVHRLGLGQSPFPVPNCVVETLRANAHQKAYLETQGLRSLREAVATFHRRNDGVNVSRSMVLIGPGSKELMFLLQVVFYGDLLVPTPCWVSYVPQARIVGHQVQLAPTTFEERWHISPESLDRMCSADPARPRIVVLNYPGNPDGLTYEVEELKSIAEVARKYQLILLSDEIYGKLHHLGNHVSVARFYPEGTIISSGLSKWCGAGGWRLGTFAFPRRLHWLLEAMTSVASETYTSTSAPIQYAAVRAFRGDQEIEIYLAHVRRILATLGNWCAHRLREVGARIWEPQGGFYLFPDFGPLAERLAVRGIRDVSQMCQRLLEDTGVAILPGTDFSRPHDEWTTRLAYVNFDGAAVLAQSQAVSLSEPLGEDFIRTHCFRTVEAVESLCDWIHG